MDISIKYVVCVVKYTTILTNIIIVKNVIFAIQEKKINTFTVTNVIIVHIFLKYGICVNIAILDGIHLMKILSL